MTSHHWHFDLHRFTEAQDAVWPQVVTELQAGRKHSHWMWFVFPQIAGLGHSPIAHHYSISGWAETEAYLADTVLAARLAKVTRLTMLHAERPLRDIFEAPDDLKFRSSMTLFARVSGDGDTIFDRALQTWQLEHDPTTLGLLSRSP